MANSGEESDTLRIVLRSFLHTERYDSGRSVGELAEPADNWRGRDGADAGKRHAKT